VFLMVGQTLGHYRIVDKIGAGGMGEVFRAHDERLDRDVAIKVIFSDVLGDEASRKQFRREALTLAKLNHPNIETVFEFDSQDGVDFLAMELIAGVTLHEKLKQGTLAESDITRLGMQLAEGLAAAHDQGVIHRDLKPGNLMITQGGRLKILDFGLAKLLPSKHDFGVTQSISSNASTGTVSGTVPYMSPEQLRGEAVDARSDLYAAGAVLYEMATGQRPFPQTHAPTLMGAILHETPARPVTLNPRVAPGLESVIMKALEKEPARRYQSARELNVALEGLASGYLPRSSRISLPALELEIPRHPATIVAAAAVALLLLAGIVFALNVGGLRNRLLHKNTPVVASSARTSPSISARRSVAVLGFKNLSGRPDEAWLSTALSEMMSTELATGEQLRTIPGENVAQMKINLSLPEDESYGKDTLNRIRANIGTDDVIVGSYLALGNGQIRFDLRLQDAAAGETLTSDSESGTEAEVSDLVARAGAKLREKLGAAAVSVAEAGIVRASLPSNPEAQRLYSEGLAKLRFFDTLAARDLLEKAIQADPQFPFAHSALSAAWGQLGYDAKGKDEAEKAFQLSSNLSHEEKLDVEGRFRATSKQWDKAIEIYRSLFEFFPDNLDYGLRLADVQDLSGKPNDALITIGSLRKLPPPSSDDPRIDLGEATVAFSLGDFHRELTAGTAAVKKGQVLGARILVARGLLEECAAQDHLGQENLAMALCNQSKDLYAQAGDESSMAWVLNILGNIYFNNGDLAGARKLFEQAQPVFRRVGQKHHLAGVLGDLANVVAAQGDLREGMKMHEESYQAFLDLGLQGDAAIELVSLSEVLTELGDLEGGEKRGTEALELSRTIGSKDTAALALDNIATAQFNLGDLPAAKKATEEGLSLCREIGAQRILAYFLTSMGQVLMTEGDLPAARKNQEEALKIRTSLGAKSEMADSDSQLAELSVEEGRPEAAEKSARDSAKEFHDENSPDLEANSWAVLARALLDEKKAADARAAIESARLAGKNSQNPETHVIVEIAEAQVLGASRLSPGLAQANASLEGALAEAAKHHMLLHEFEARLALGEIEIKSGKLPAGRARFAALEKEATSKGALLIARKARAAAEGTK
jgi:serine/threonine protein kinase/tetratricopeptide (TPR) repeat protein